MKPDRVWRRTCRYVGLIVASFLLVLVLGYLTPRQWWVSPQVDCSREIRVASNGFHTALIVPLQTAELDWRSYLPLNQVGNGSITGYRYLGFGWGEREFYLNTRTPGQLKLSTIVQALFLSPGSVVDVNGYTDWPVSSPGFTVTALWISPSDYQALMQFLRQSFYRTPQGQVHLVQQGYYPNSSLFQAQGQYSLFRTCNTWTAEGLRSARINTPLWSGLAPAITLHLRNGCSVPPDQSVRSGSAHQEVTANQPTPG